LRDSFLRVGPAKGGGGEEENGIFKWPRLSSCSRSARTRGTKGWSLLAVHQGKREKKKFQGRPEGEERERSEEGKKLTEEKRRDRVSSRKSVDEEEEEEEGSETMDQIRGREEIRDQRSEIRDQKHAPDIIEWM